jgi:hypothetical protein
MDQKEPRLDFVCTWISVNRERDFLFHGSRTVYEVTRKMTEKQRELGNLGSGKPLVAGSVQRLGKRWYSSVQLFGDRPSGSYGSGVVLSS